jgi:hypothetical protein
MVITYVLIARTDHIRVVLFNRVVARSWKRAFADIDVHSSSGTI